ncbi:MAG: triose-phosphate isomerase [Papillibacter sp.]|nr:triose-phosphate isomerase [Papillibacter sp.]
MNKKYRRALIAGNWKMNLLVSDVKPYADTFKSALGKSKGCDIAICVPHLLIPAAIKAFKDTRVAIGAQDASECAKGARTGEVSAVQLKEIGVKYVIIGHSERRHYHSEGGEIGNGKVKTAHEAGLIPIVCVGETLGQRERGVELELVRMQVKEALYKITPEALKRTVIAYEPVWAIGTGKTATAEQAEQMCAEIRAVIRCLYGARPARGVTILYGGSMNEENAEELLAQPDIDGGLIGGASLDAEKFAAIVEVANK